MIETTFKAGSSRAEVYDTILIPALAMIEEARHSEEMTSTRAEEILQSVEEMVEELTAGTEGFVLVPRGAAHTFGNAAGSEARLLVIHAPAMDAYFAGLHDLWNRAEPPSSDEERALMARFGMEAV